MALRTAMSSAIGLVLMTKCRRATIRDRRLDRDPRSAHGAPYAETLFPCRIATPVIPERHGVPHIRLSRMTASSASVRFGQQPTHRTYGHGKLNVRRALTPPANASEGANLRATSPARRGLAFRPYSNRADDLLRRARIRRRRDDPCRYRRC